MVVSYVHPEYLISVKEPPAAEDPSLRVFDTSVLLHATDQLYSSRARYPRNIFPSGSLISAKIGQIRHRPQ